MLKDSSLIAVLAVTDLMRQGMIVASDTFRAFEAYTFVAVVYYVLTVIVARGLTVIERRYAISGWTRDRIDRGGSAMSALRGSPGLGRAVRQGPPVHLGGATRPLLGEAVRGGRAAEAG